MVIALIGLALAMIAGGVWSVIEGYGIIVLERGWALVIAGATVASLGAVLLGLAAAVARLGAIRGELGRLRERMSRPEPDFPEPPGRVDPVLAVSSGLLAGGATGPDTMEAPVFPPTTGPATAPPQPSRTDAAPGLTPVPDDVTTARIARREEAAHRRAKRAAREGAPAESVSAGTIAAGAAVAVAAGAAVSAGLAAVRGRGDRDAEEATPVPAAGPLPAVAPVGDLHTDSALRGLERPLSEGPVGDELLPDRDVGASAAAPESGPAAPPVTWPVVPTGGPGDPPPFPSGPSDAGAHAITPSAGALPEAAPTRPAGSSEEDAPFATRDPVVPDAAPGADSPAGAEERAVLGTYNSGGNRYVMFSDGSIEAETPDGMFRFGSLDELKAFIASGGERPQAS